VVAQFLPVLKVVSLMDMQTVLELTSPDLFIKDLAASDKEGVLAEMVDVLVSGSSIQDKETLLQMLINREALGSTAVGPGVAFPHGRTLATQNLVIVTARSRKGVAFDSIDGEPTHLFFMLVAPPQDSGNQYIQSLAVLTDKLQNAELRDAASAAEDYDGFRQVLMEG